MDYDEDADLGRMNHEELREHLHMLEQMEDLKELQVRLLISCPPPLTTYHGLFLMFFCELCTYVLMFCET